MKQPILELKGIHKSFPGVKALDDACLNVYPGKVMALMGENGAGKSTLMKVLTGIYSLDAGEIFYENKQVKFNGPRHSQEAGISIIHQELNLIPELTIAENIFLGREITNAFGAIKWSLMFDEAQILLDRLNVKHKPSQLLGELSLGEQQMVEIAKALSFKSQIIIMDEPTDALTETETASLFTVINELREEGYGIVYISHRLKEIFEICDDITVLRDGKFIAERSVAETDEDSLIELMVGRRLDEQYPRVESKHGTKCLEIKNLSAADIDDISFTLDHGEILGISGLILGLSVKENMSLCSLKQLSKGLQLDHGAESVAVEDFIRLFNIKTPSKNQIIGNLSGGNQQKVAIAKGLMTRPKVLILDEPTRGVDVGAKKEIYQLINQFKQEGMSIILVSSEMPEVLGMSDRILVMYQGRISGEFMADDADQEKLMACAFGHHIMETTA